MVTKKLAIGVPLIIIGSVLTVGLLPLFAGIYLLIKGIATKFEVENYYRNPRNPGAFVQMAFTPDNRPTVSYKQALKMNAANFCHFFHEPKKPREVVTAVTPTEEERTGDKQQAP